MFNIIKKICRIPHRLYLIIRYKICLRSFGFTSYIASPLQIDGGYNINVGNHVLIGYKTWLAALPLTGEEKCVLDLKDGVSIGHFNHIYATKKIVLEENVLTADKVYISDNLHEYKNIRIPIKQQPVIQNKEVIIGSGSWLGENVCILGAVIGKQCVIGANSVVTKDIPDYCVAVGIPARIVKRYCFETQTWRKTDSKGCYLD